MHDMKAPESDPLRGPPCSLKNPSLGTPSGDFVTNLPPHTDPFFSTSQNPQNVPMDVDSEFSTPTYTCGVPLQMMPPVGTPGGAILASPSQGNLWASGPGMIPVDPPLPGNVAHQKSQHESQSSSPKIIEKDTKNASWTQFVENPLSSKIPLHPYENVGFGETFGDKSGQIAPPAMGMGEPSAYQVVPLNPPSFGSGVPNAPVCMHLTPPSTTVLQKTTMEGPMGPPSPGHRISMQT